MMFSQSSCWFPLGALIGSHLTLKNMYVELALIFMTDVQLCTLFGNTKLCKVFLVLRVYVKIFFIL